MRARLTAILLVVVATLGSANVVRAAGGDSGRTSASSDQDKGEVTTSAAQEFSGGRRASGSGSSAPRCSYDQFDIATSGIPGAGTGIVRRDAATHETLVDVPSSQSTETLYRRTCSGQAPDYVWVPDGVSVDDLLSSARQQVTAQLPVPEMDMNPSPAVGGTVYIGLWLAVVDPGDVSITASVGPVWATVTARYVGTTWDMGNGDVVECDGLGTPIVDHDTVEQGPCGYTYEWPSAPKFTGTDDLAYHASATGHWAVTYATSTGSGGSLGTLDRSTDFLYQVRELQTVRVGDDG